ncbi:hypothetical protein DFH06DRAFT_1405930 [Mycena polygramma]|nr:hypothetical protein DFH06DRAFT_1405930 [Mycena polygramma]
MAGITLDWYRAKSAWPYADAPCLPPSSFCMPPLSRQRTLESILSRWSDSHPPGATMDLHRATKPLMRLMDHQTVRRLIGRNRGTPLSEETLKLYWDYLADKDLAPATKRVILGELCRRAKSVEEAHTVVDSARNSVFPAILAPILVAADLY